MLALCEDKGKGAPSGNAYSNARKETNLNTTAITTALQTVAFDCSDRMITG